MIRNFVFTREAEADVLAIWAYIADDDTEVAADRVISRIYEECAKLGETPGMGHRRENLLDDRYRFWTVWSYLIVYQWHRLPLRVIAIVHGARDLDAFFADR